MVDVLLLALPMVLFVAAGVAGVARGRAVSRRWGPDTLLLYPIPLRFRRYEVTARWAVRVGVLQILIGLVLPLAMLGDAINPFSILRRRDSACRHVVVEADFGAPGIAKLQHVFDDGVTCSAWFVSGRPSRFVEEMASVSLTGDGWGSHEIDRSAVDLRDKGYEVEVRDPPKGRVLVALAPEDTGQHILLFERPRLSLRITLPAKRNDSERVDEWVERVESRITLIDRYGAPRARGAH